jgi:hypothetical protein
VRELKEKVVSRAAKGTELQRVLEDLQRENDRLLEERSLAKTDLVKGKDLRRIRKSEADDYSERLKRARGIQANNMERLRRMKEHMLERDTELEGV